jgi:hypothetical protein
MIWALLGALIAATVVGGAAAAGNVEVRFPAHDRLEEVIEDETRREQADEIMTEAEQTFAENAASQLRTLQRIREISADRSTTRAEIEGVFEDEVEHNRAEQFIDLRFRLKNTMTREEWEAVFSPPES